MTTLDQKQPLQRKDPHIIVVGAGILGASIAFHLTLHGAQVTLIDAADPGQGATRVSFAWLNAYGKTPFHYHDLNRRSLDMWARFARRLGQGIDLIWGGDLRWTETSAGANELIKRVKTLQAWGYPPRLIDAAELKKLEPDLAIKNMTAASYTDIDGHVDTGQVVQACLAAIAENGGEICLHTPVTGLKRTASHSGITPIQAVITGEHEIPCDAVVLAGGPDMPALAKLAAIDLPFYHTFGATILTEPLPPLFKTIALYHPRRDKHPLINIRQFSDGTVMVQGPSDDNIQQGDRGQSAEEVSQILQDAATLLPQLHEAKVKEARRGRRPIPQDGHPIIGFTESVPNLYLTTTHSGVTLAPIIGELAAIEIVHGADIDLFRPYRLARFGW